jgi:hypothetical protein
LLHAPSWFFVFSVLKFLLVGITAGRPTALLRASLQLPGLTD